MDSRAFLRVGIGFYLQYGPYQSPYIGSMFCDLPEILSVVNWQLESLRKQLEVIPEGPSTQI